MIGLFQYTFDEQAIPEKHENRENSYNSEEVSKLIADAEATAFEKGYTEGYANGYSENERHLQAAANRAIADLQKQIRTFNQQISTFTDSLEKEAAAFVVSIVRRVLPGFAKHFAPVTALDSIRTTLKLAQGVSLLRIHLSPQTKEYMLSNGIDIAAWAAPGQTLDIIVDPALADGDSRLEWENGYSEYSLDRICDEILEVVKKATPEILNDKD